jgi:hypothetical protein
VLNHFWDRYSAQLFAKLLNHSKTSNARARGVGARLSQGGSQLLHAGRGVMRVGSAGSVSRLARWVQVMDLWSITQGDE